MKSHRTDALSLSFGLVFLVAVGWWLISRSLDVNLPNVGWLVAAALIVFGVLGLIGAFRSEATPEPAEKDEIEEEQLNSEAAALDLDGRHRDPTDVT